MRERERERGRARDKRPTFIISICLSYFKNYHCRNLLETPLGGRPMNHQAWGPLVGNPTGTYCLDMSDRRHVIAARRLALINHKERAHGISGTAGGRDTSQVRGEHLNPAHNFNGFRVSTHFWLYRFVFCPSEAGSQETAHRHRTLPRGRSRAKPNDIGN